MAVISQVFTLSSAALCLGISEALLNGIADTLEPEDGVLWVHEGAENGYYGFTSFGLETVQDILNDEPTITSIRKGIERRNDT